MLLVPACHHGMVKEEQTIIVNPICKKSIHHFYGHGCKQALQDMFISEDMAVVMCDFAMEQTEEVGAGCHMAYMELLACWGRLNQCGDCMQVFMEAGMACRAAQTTY